MRLKELELEGGVPLNEIRERVFSRLRPYCIELLDLIRNPSKSSSFLAEMADFLRCAPPAGLQPCLDYTLFPLLLLLDASIQCRSGKKADSSGSFFPLDSSFGGQMISDSVAEGTLSCLEELLRKCYLGSVNQMVVVLKNLTFGALLSPTEASEEFREGIIKCLKVLLLRLQPCFVGSCSCKDMFFLPMLVTALEDTLPNAAYYKPEECLLSFLQSKDASAAVGHWLSLLLQVAEAEVVRGHRGSASLRKEAFLTLRVLVAKVGTADALAFFLPGIVSRFTRALLVTKTMISGSAGNAASIEHAVLGLTEYLIIVLRDEANLNGLQISTSEMAWRHQNVNGSTQTVLDVLRHLPASPNNQSEDSLCQSTQIHLKDDNKGIIHDENLGTRSLYVQRTKDWVAQTTAHVDKLLSSTFPHLCVHPAEKVRKALVDGTMGLLSNCSCTLQRSRLMLLECLCVLVCDDSDVVSCAAQDSLNSLFVSDKKFVREINFSELFESFIERLPKVVLGSEELVALSHVRRLLALMYYAGPELVVHHIFCSPMKAARFLEIFILSLGHNSQFAGSIDKLISSKPLSVGYLLSVAQLKSGSLSSGASHCINRDSLPLVSEMSMENPSENMCSDYEFPRTPPWFLKIGSQKLYLALAGILRLAGLSIMAGSRSDASLLGLVDNLLEHIRKLIYELRKKAYNKESWQSWYSHGDSGQLLRQTSSVVCVLNEIIYGLAGGSINSCLKFFKAQTDVEVPEKLEFVCDSGQLAASKYRSAWIVHQGKDAREHIIHCVGSILHEYTSSEIWDLPVDPVSSQLEHETETNISLYIFRDSRMLHQVIIEGIGIFSKVLGKDFISSGFMHSTLYLLLENLNCSNVLIRSTSDAALHVLSTNTGHSNVGHLVVTNADYIVDSLCRQLRHLDLNPHVPNVLAAMLSYIGAAKEILPLLEEPMRAILSELEVLGRYQHPHLTVPFLRAVMEVSKASRSESLRLPSSAKSFNSHVMEISFSAQVVGENNSVNMAENGNFTSIQLQLEQLQELLFKLNEMRRYRTTIGSLASSCLKTATPLAGSKEESACLVALDILEDATLCLAKVEEAYRHEKETKAAIERAIHLCCSNELKDEMDAQDDDINENRLLPAMNETWPYLILCLKNRISVAAVGRCARVLAKSVQISGGNFFTRRFQTDGPVIWKLLATSPFQRKNFPSRDKGPLLLPYRSTSQTTEDPMAESSTLKIQAAILNMIADIASDKSSASALQMVFNKVSGLAVGIACSGIGGLMEASVNCLKGLACINPDPVWLLLADVYYSLKDKDAPNPPAPELGTISELLPPPMPSMGYLYAQYAGKTFGFDVDPASVELVFQRLNSEVFK